jgi:hypothetical protein
LKSSDPSEFGGTNRLVLIFTPSTEDETYARQLSLLEGQEAAFEDRDLLTITFPEDGSDDSASARRRFGIEPDDFATILVGKDGGEKFRSGEPVRPEELFGLIDAMPMRRREMRARGSG